MDIEKLRKRYQGPMTNQDIMDCIAEIERLRKALEFYANRIAYCYHSHTEGHDAEMPVLQDEGKIAREALKER